MQLDVERLNGVVGLAHDLEEKIVLRESHLQHAGLQSREIDCRPSMLPVRNNFDFSDWADQNHLSWQAPYS